MSTLGKPILCLGDLCPDIILPYGETKAVLSALERGETAAGQQRGARVQPGGSVGNTAAGLARLGTPVFFAGTVGDDVYGRMLRDDLAKEGVDVRHLRLGADLATVLVLVIVEEDGGRVTYALPRTGASHHQLTPGQIPRNLPAAISWLHTTGMTLREEPAASTALALMAECGKAGVGVSLDINSRIESVGDEAFLRNIQKALKLSTVVMGSGPDELMPLTGGSSPEEAARILANPKRTVVCRMGALGAAVYTCGGEFRQEAFPVTVADTVGAGDAYNSGFLAAVWRNRPPREANRWGCAAGGACVSVPGARGCPTLPKLLDILSAFPEETDEK